jgi:hypothetical protein
VPYYRHSRHERSIRANRSQVELEDAMRKAAPPVAARPLLVDLAGDSLSFVHALCGAIIKQALPSAFGTTLADRLVALHLLLIIDLGTSTTTSRAETRFQSTSFSLTYGSGTWIVRAANSPCVGTIQYQSEPKTTERTWLPPTFRPEPSPADVW